MKPLTSANNVLNILFVWKDHNCREIGLNQISKLTGINKGTVYRILYSLKERNLVEQNPETRKYRLSFGLLELGNFILKDLDLREVAHPIIKELAYLCGETVTLGIRTKNNFIFIDRVDGRENVRFYCDIGKIAPFYGGAAAKALFAHLDPADIKEIITDMRHDSFTHKTLSVDELLSQIKTIQKHGYSVSDEEVDIGVLAFGAPIFDHRGKAVAGMAIAGLKHTFDDDKIKRFEKLITEYSHKISTKMGYSG